MPLKIGLYTTYNLSTGDSLIPNLHEFAGRNVEVIRHGNIKMKHLYFFNGKLCLIQIFCLVK